MPVMLESWKGATRRSPFATAVAMLVVLAFVSSAKASEASWSFEPASWDFGTRIPGTGPSPPKAFTLTNTGEVELQSFFVAVGGSDGAGFSLTGNSCGKLVPGASCTIDVTFNPTIAGEKHGQLSVSSMGGLAPPASAELSGTGAGPRVSIAPEMEV